MKKVPAATVERENQTEEKKKPWGTKSSKCYYPGQKNRYSREIHEVDPRSDHVISCDIELRFDIDATRGPARHELAFQIKVDLA